MSKFQVNPDQFRNIVPGPQLYNQSLGSVKYLNKIKALPLANSHALLHAASQQARSNILQTSYTLVSLLGYFVL